MSLQSVTELSFDFPSIRPIDIEISRTPLTSDAGLLPIAHFDEQIGWTRRIADAVEDQRDETAVNHSVLSMVRQRIFGILADYADQNDHDTLRSDPVFKLLAGRLPTDKDLASQPTLSRFENAVSIADLRRLQAVFVDQFIASFAVPPRYLTLDVDAFDDPAHGHQQLTFFHGYYGNHQYLPIVFTCAENDAVLSIGLRHGTCAAYLGADDDLRYLVQRLRAAWPAVEIHLRGDGGFGVPVMIDACRELQIFFTLGIGQNPRVQKLGDAILAEAQQRYTQTGQAQRVFDRASYQADSWPEPQDIVIKAEVSALGTNRRAVITNRPGCQISPQGIYDGYVERGESENRNKELKCDLQADRLSDHRFVANYFRLYLHAATLNILVRLRQTVTPPAPTAAELGIVTPLADSALDGPARRQFFNRRRLWDPLRNGCASTWRTQLIKVAAEVVTRARRVVIRLSASWPHLKTFQDVSRQIVKLHSLSIPSG